MDKLKRIRQLTEAISIAKSAIRESVRELHQARGRSDMRSSQSTRSTRRSFNRD